MPMFEIMVIKRTWRPIISQPGQPAELEIPIKLGIERPTKTIKIAEIMVETFCSLGLSGPS